MECGGKRASDCTLRIFRSASDEGGNAKSSVRSAMCIGTASPIAWPSSVGAACFLVTKARPISPSPTETCRSYGAWLYSGRFGCYKHGAPKGASQQAPDRDPCKVPRGDGRTPLQRLPNGGSDDV